MFSTPPHVTADDVERALVGQGPVTVTFGRVRAFPAGNDGVPLYVEVFSPDLDRLHERLKTALPNKQTHASYKPHVTIAYVSPDAVEKYAGQPGPLDGKTATFDTIVHSATDRTQTPIKLGQDQAAFDGGHWVTIDGNPVLIGGGASAIPPHGMTPQRAALAVDRLFRATAPLPLGEQAQLLSRASGAPVDLTGLDLKQTMPVARTMAQLAQDYPLTKIKLGYVGAEYAPSDPWVGPPNRWQWDHEAIGQTTGDNQGTEFIGLNARYFGENTAYGTPERTVPAMIAHGVKTGYYAPEAATAGAAWVGAHEYGHVVQDDVTNRNLAATLDYQQFAAEQREAGKPPISGYAETSYEENFAETFAARYFGSTTPQAQAMGQLLTAVYGSAPTAKSAAFADGGHWVTIDGNAVLIGGAAAGPGGGATVRDRGAPATGAPQGQQTAAGALSYLREAPGALPRATVEHMVNQAIPGNPIVSLIDLKPSAIDPQMVSLAEVAQDYPTAAKDLAYTGVYSGVGEPRTKSGGPVQWPGGAAFAATAAVQNQGADSGAIGFNPSYFGNMNQKTMDEVMQHNVDVGWYPKVATQPGYLAAHEFGHIIQGDMEKEPNNELTQRWLDQHPPDGSLGLYSAVANDAMDESGRQATTTAQDHERFAEAFASYYYGSSHPYAKDMGELLKSYYGSAPRRNTP